MKLVLFSLKVDFAPPKVFIQGHAKGLSDFRLLRNSSVGLPARTASNMLVVRMLSRSDARKC